jgi:hypothetical protein
MFVAAWYEYILSIQKHDERKNIQQHANAQCEEKGGTV